MTDDKITIQLTHAQALVLFDWISRDGVTEGLSYEDQAEEQVLWTLEGQLEKQIGELFSDNYKELLAAARDKVRDNPDG